MERVLTPLVATGSVASPWWMPPRRLKRRRDWLRGIRAANSLIRSGGGVLMTSAGSLFNSSAGTGCCCGECAGCACSVYSVPCSHTCDCTPSSYLLTVTGGTVANPCFDCDLGVAESISVSGFGFSIYLHQNPDPAMCGSYTYSAPVGPVTVNQYFFPHTPGCPGAFAPDVVNTDISINFGPSTCTGGITDLEISTSAWFLFKYSGGPVANTCKSMTFPDQNTKLECYVGAPTPACLAFGSTAVLTPCA